MQSIYPLIPFAVMALGLIVAVLIFRKKVSAGGSSNQPGGSRGRPGADKH